MNLKNQFTWLHSSLKVLQTALVILPLLFDSCVTQRNLEYMRSDKSSPVEYKEAVYSDYMLKPNDALYINISSVDDAASNVFAQSTVQQALEPYGAYMNSYTVDQEGFVQLPIIGKINVSGKTTIEVSEMIKDSVANILSLPMVSVRLVNRYISILGEVNHPGHFIYSQDKFTIFNAIGLAGDIGKYGNRKEVILTRNENGKNIKIKIDLTRPDILSSPYYFVQPNDFIYVSPLRQRFWGISEFPFTIVFSIISTSLLIYTIILQQPSQ
jgi:polysaccharide export outer membrane protein